MSALRNPRFRRLLIGESISSFGDSAMFLSLGIWAKDLTGSNTDAGLVFLFLTAPQAVAPFLGHLADLVRRRSLMIWTDVFGILLVLGLLTVHHPGDLWKIYAVAVGYGLMSAVPARAGLVKDMLPSDDAASAQSLLSSIGEGARILSPVIGAGIYVGAGGGTLALVDAATFAVAIAALLSIRVVESPVEETEEPFRRRFVAGFRFLSATPLLRQLTLVLTSFLAVAGLLETGLFSAIQHGLHRTPAFYGVLLSVQGAGTIVGAVVASVLVKRLGVARAAGIGLFGAAVGLGMVIVRPSVPTFAAGLAVVGASIGLIFVGYGTAQQLYVPSRLMGRVGAAMGTLMTVSQSVSIAVGAAVVAVLDWRLMFGISAATALACGLVMALCPAPAPQIQTSVADTGFAGTGTAGTGIADPGIVDPGIVDPGFAAP